MSSKQSREQALEIQRRVRNAVREAVSARRIQSSAGPITEKATEEILLPRFPRHHAGSGGRYSTFLEHVWRPLLLKAGLPYRKFHSTRHTFATWALEGCEEKGIPPTPILAVRHWMGHASVEETEGYLHRDRASRAAAVNHLDAYVSA